MTPDAIDLGEGLTRATGGADARQAGDITADAFAADPFNRWMLGNPAAIRGVFSPLIRDVYAPRGLVYRLGDEGAASWMLPGGDSTLPFWTEQRIRLAVLLKASRGAIDRVERTVAAMEAAHPAYPHAYLFTIGVRPRFQGKGIGRRLIAPVLAACDAAGLPAYLENSNPANTNFYVSCGFEHAGWIVPREDAAPLQAMLRQPRPGPAQP